MPRFLIIFKLFVFYDQYKYNKYCQKYVPAIFGTSENIEKIPKIFWDVFKILEIKHQRK